MSRADRPPRGPGEPVRFVFVGNHFSRKGGPRLLAMHQQRFAERIELHVCSARAEPDRRARNVVWHGRVPRSRLLEELLPDMDVFIMPTSEDMQPWALIEAAAVGLPIITTRMAGIPDVVAHGESGLLCEAGDWEAVGRAMQRLADDADLRDRMGRAGRSRIERDFDPDRHFGGLLDRLKTLARSRSEAGSSAGSAVAV